MVGLFLYFWNSSCIDCIEAINKIKDLNLDKNFYKVTYFTRFINFSRAISKKIKENIKVK